MTIFKKGNIKSLVIFRKAITFCLFVIMFSFWSCEKDDSNGNILVTVNSNGKAVPQATVYIKLGTLTNPNIPLSEYDKVRGADAVGQVYFDELPPNNYFIYATGYDSELNRSVKGEASVTIKPRYRQNEYNLTVVAN